MASIIVVGTTKGGAGKSTTVALLASMFLTDPTRNGAPVMILDTDVQASASDWVDFRQEYADKPQAECINRTGRHAAETARQQADRLGPDGIVLVDVAGVDTPAFRSLLLIADLLIVPVKASAPDIKAMAGLKQIVDEVWTQNPMLGVATLVNEGGTTTPQKAAARSSIRSVLYSLWNPEGGENNPPQWGLFSSVLAWRPVYCTVIGSGLGVHEIAGVTGNTRSEVAGLYREVTEALTELKQDAA